MDCRISGNVDDGIGGSFSSLWVWADFAVRSSVIANNGGWGITLVNEQNDGALILENVTLNGNQAGGVAADFPDCIISNTLMTGNGGTIPITRSAQVETVDITCTDLWDNTGGDWIDWLAPYLADPGNFSANPYYCDATVGNYTIGDVSPCAPGHHPNGVDCGLIGAEDVACAVVFSPMIASIDDVGNDQGRQVRIVWDRALLDDPSVTEPVTAYAVYRRQDEYKTAGGATAPSPGDRRGQRVLGWDFIETVPARGDEIYQYVAPTLCDSTAAGICWSVFFISAMTSDPFVFYDSAVDSGYSIDDLVPPDPTGFAVAYGLQNQLSWDENPAPDLAWYEVFRGETPDFPATPDHLVCQIQSLDWTDADGSWQHHYKLAAVDNVGNRSNAVDPDNVTDVGEGAPPRRTTLAAAVPNPFNPATTIAYALAHTGRVRLRVYDVVGRVVRELVAGELQTAGRYEIVWNGRDDTGRHVASGTYAVRLEAGTTVDTRLVTLLK